jgi:peptide deformylase
MPKGEMIDLIITNYNILRQISNPTTMEEVKELDLKRRLRKSLKTAWAKGAGLSAIQIGVPVRFAWYSLFGREKILLNPVLLEGKGWNVSEHEACLSIPNSHVNVMRFFWISYETGGLKRTAMNFEALLIQHEIDHMDGILNIDRRIQCQKV